MNCHFWTSTYDRYIEKTPKPTPVTNLRCAKLLEITDNEQFTKLTDAMHRLGFFKLQNLATDEGSELQNVFSRTIIRKETTKACKLIEYGLVPTPTDIDRAMYADANFLLAALKSQKLNRDELDNIFKHAIKNKQYEIVAYLLNRINYANIDLPSGDTPLHVACKNNDSSTALLLIQHYRSNGICVDLTNAYRETPLHYACYHGMIAVVRALFNHLANKNAIDSHHLSPLGYACLNKKIKVVELLLTMKADVREGNTVAAAMCTDSDEIVDIILNQCKERFPMRDDLVNFLDRSHALSMAVERGRLKTVEKLLALGVAFLQGGDHCKLFFNFKPLNHRFDRYISKDKCEAALKAIKEPDFVQIIKSLIIGKCEKIYIEKIIQQIPPAEKRSILTAVFNQIDYNRHGSFLLDYGASPDSIMYVRSKALIRRLARPLDLEIAIRKGWSSIAIHVLMGNTFTNEELNILLETAYSYGRIKVARKLQSMGAVIENWKPQFFDHAIKKDSPQKISALEKTFGKTDVDYILKKAVEENKHEVFKFFIKKTDDWGLYAQILDRYSPEKLNELAEAEPEKFVGKADWRHFNQITNPKNLLPHMQKVSYEAFQKWIDNPSHGFYDTVLSAGETKFYVNSHLLKNNNLYFKGMFAHDWKKEYTFDEKPEHFCLLLQWIYTGSVAFTQENFVLMEDLFRRYQEEEGTKSLCKWLTPDAITYDTFKDLAKLNRTLKLPLTDAALKDWLKAHPECQSWNKYLGRQ